MTVSRSARRQPTTPTAADRDGRAAERIWHLWQAGDVTSDLPADLKPATAAAGYAIQAELDRLSGHTRVGWKLAATSEGGQRHIAVDGPIIGRIFAARVLPPGATTSLAQNRMRVVEPEFAFRFGRTLPAREKRYTVDEVMDAVTSLHLSFELPDSRFIEFTAVGGPTLIAENACAHELVVGPPVDMDWRALDLSRHAVRARVRNGEAVRDVRDGTGANVLGDPRLALTWFANRLSELGAPAAAGEFVTTGTCMTPLAVTAGDDVVADYGCLGSLSVRLS